MANTGLQQSSGGMDAGRLMSLIGGGVAMAWALRRRDLPGMLVGAAGGMLMAYGISGARSGGQSEAVDIRTSVRIERSPEDLYNFWHGFTRLPQFMKFLKEVTPRGPNRTHWVANAPVGPTIEWDSEVTADEPNTRIAWRSVEGSELPNDGEVRFIPAATSRDQATMVEVAMRFQPPGGMIGSAMGKMLRGLTEKEIQSDLQTFKRMMESGEGAKQADRAL